jgi:hypothetical protein
VFLAARLKYSRTVAVRWGSTMVLERLLRAQLAIFEELGGVPWACLYDYVARHVIEVTCPPPLRGRRLQVGCTAGARREGLDT